jgi:predicted metal-dependent phosphoesterase TrpH
MARASGGAMSWTFVVHAHTHHSFDSLTAPRALVARAVALGIDVLAVTDHDTWQGAVECRAAAAGRPLQVVIGSEVATDQGDVIGLFLTSDVRERRARAFCDAVHAQGGLSLLPHPYKWHRLDDALLAKIDLVEVHNGRTPRADNERAAALAAERGLPALVGPDAHRAGELSLARVIFEGERPADDTALKRALLSAPRRFEIATGSMWNEWLSQGVKLLRRPSRRAAWGFVRSGVRRVLKPGEYVLG